MSRASSCSCRSHSSWCGGSTFFFRLSCRERRMASHEEGHSTQGRFSSVPQRTRSFLHARDVGDEPAGFTRSDDDRVHAHFEQSGKALRGGGLPRLEHEDGILIVVPKKGRK